MKLPVTAHPMGNFFQPIMVILQPQPLPAAEVEPLSTSASTDLAI